MNSAGTVTAVAEGKCTITAGFLGGKLTCTVYVTKPAETEPIVLEPCLNTIELSIQQGDSSVISVENYQGTVTWISDNTVAATVKADGNPLSATISGIKKGTAKIYAMLSNGNTLTCTVTVSEPEQQLSKLWGDTDINDEINVLDAVLLARIASNDTTLVDGEVSEQGKINSDVTHDGVITSADLSKLLTYLAKQISDEDLAKAS